MSTPFSGTRRGRRRLPEHRDPVAAEPRLVAAAPAWAPPPVRTGRTAGRRRGTGLFTWLLALFGLFATGLGLGQLGTGPGLHLFGGPASGGPKSAALPRSVPTRVSIPRIGVSAPVRSVGLDAAGDIAVPPLSEQNAVGWYQLGPTPGQDGPAVLVGHVDTRSGPAVFANVGRLKLGDRVLVSRTDNRLATFRVDAVRAYPKSAVPADQVYGDFSRPGLRLITCGGDWVGGRLGYADNIVVYASLTHP